MQPTALPTAHLRRATAPRVSPLLADELDALVCPRCGDDLAMSGRQLYCRSRAHRYEVEDGIPLLFVPTQAPPAGDVTTTMRQFYETYPFPDYEDTDTPSALRRKAHRSVLPRLLDEQLPYDARILEVGCGTGQLTNFLGGSRMRRVFGADMCQNSLRLGERFRRAHDVPAVAFMQMNLFRPPFKAGQFDVVICNGVLHHTSDPLGGFRSIVRLVRPGGLVLIGLYNRYGRMQTAMRRRIYGIVGERWRRLDFRLRDDAVGARRRKSWFMDQYRNPRESSHTMDEVLRWFAQDDVTFVSSLPRPRPFESLGEHDALFAPTSPGTRADRLLAQLVMAVTGGTEGGLFLMIGRRQAR
jgi:SAM-dependent methyltransferase